MQRILLNGKVHRATVTQADLQYVGSLTIDRTLMDAAGLVPGEQVQVDDAEIATHSPRVVHVNERNEIARSGSSR